MSRRNCSDCSESFQESVLNYVKTRGSWSWSPREKVDTVIKCNLCSEKYMDHCDITPVTKQSQVILEKSMETASLLKDELLTSQQEILQLKLRVMKLEEDIKAEQQKNSLLKVELDGEKSLFKVLEEGFIKLVKEKDMLDEENKRLTVLLDAAERNFSSDSE